MASSSIRILVVDDFERWRLFVLQSVQKEREIKVVGQASDGLEAVQQAQELQPDVILLDIGLPTLNGIEAALRIRVVSPYSRVLFVSENGSVDTVEAAMNTGAGGFVRKSDAASELLTAIREVHAGKQFLSASLNLSTCSPISRQPWLTDENRPLRS
jgi:DNA-binding NarL/FixJ family response regulator